MNEQDPTEPVTTNRALLAEMVSLRDDLNREQWHKRALVAVAALSAALLVLVAVGYFRVKDTTDQLHDTTARLDQTVADLQAQRVATVAAVCGSDQGLINTFLSFQPPPVDFVQMWQQQARLDDFEREFEQQLAAIGCDLKLDPIRSPPVVDAAPPASTPTLSAAAATVARNALAGITSLFTPPSTTVPGLIPPPVVAPPTTRPTAPPTTSTTLPAPPPTKPNGKPCNGNPPPCR